jgi:hypothetical protein
MKSRENKSSNKFLTPRFAGWISQILSQVGLIRIEDEQFGYIEVTSQCILEPAKSSALKVACLLGK